MLLCIQAVLQEWEYYQRHSVEPKIVTPSDDKVVKVVELDLDKNGQLQEVNRHPGENEVLKNVVQYWLE